MIGILFTIEIICAFPHEKKVIGSNTNVKVKIILCKNACNHKRFFFFFFFFLGGGGGGGGYYCTQK